MPVKSSASKKHWQSFFAAMVTGEGGFNIQVE
jgi:hypothetical protein